MRNRWMSAVRFFVFLLVLGVSSTVAVAQTCPTTLEGAVWFDSNQNGVRDPGEQGIYGYGVRIYNSFWGYTGEMLTGRIATQQGRYIFPVVTTETYYICVQLGGGWIQTHPDGSENKAVLNIGPHNPDTSGSPDEGRYCWEVNSSSPNRGFGVYQIPGE